MWLFLMSLRPAPSTIKGKQRIDHDRSYLCSNVLKMPNSEIVSCYRTGRVRKDKQGVLLPRPLVVVFKSEDMAHYWCNGGRGYQSPCGKHWVNEDLCIADRDAKYFVRKERRNRQEARAKEAASVPVTEQQSQVS